ncbi:MAG: alpha/beta hydrolase [Gemmatimonadota bacterium]|nr:alpha/beta hydrolase [Gemmatimonadota bacterium]
MTEAAGYLIADGVRLETRWWGEPAPEAVVLLHEGLGCVAMWRDFPERLADRLARPVFAYSRAGYGRSDPVALPRPVTYMHHEGDVVLPEVLDAAGIERATLIGHSDGGSIAIVQAGSGDPRIDRLVLIAAHVFNEPVSRETIAEVGRRYEKTDLRARLAKRHGANVDVVFHGWHDVWLSEGFREWNLEPYLPSIRVPTLVIQGEDDDFGTRAQVEAIVGGVAGPVESVLIPDCGHAPHRDRPDVLLETIAGFLA